MCCVAGKLLRDVYIHYNITTNTLGLAACPACTPGPGSQARYTAHSSSLSLLHVSSAKLTDDQRRFCCTHTFEKYIILYKRAFPKNRLETPLPGLH